MGSFAAFCKKKADAVFFCISFLHNNVPVRPYRVYAGAIPFGAEGIFSNTSPSDTSDIEPVRAGRR